MSEWYLSHAGKKTGPLRAKQIAKLIAGGAFRANEAKVWKEGMQEWKFIPESGVLAQASLEPDVDPALAMDSVDKKPEPATPYTAPKSLPSREQFGEIAYGGIGRLAFFLAPLVIVAAFISVLVMVFGASMSVETVSEPVMAGGVIALYAGVFIAIIWINIARLKNLAMSGWWVLGLIVPILNVWLQWRQFACPEGYANHRELDTIGKVLTFVFVIIPLAIVAIGLLSAVGTELLPDQQ